MNPLLINAVRLPTNSENVVDADEEVFLLYSELQRRTSNTPPDRLRGLGHVDSRQNVLTVTIELKGGDIPIDFAEIELGPKKRMKNKTKNRIRRIEDKTIEIDLAQDTTALRSRKGDTGSVLWHASVDFARVVLQQVHLKPQECMFDLDLLKDQHILELGSGTGILSLLVSPLCRRYTATDIQELIPLIQKNIRMKHPPGPTTVLPNIQARSLDWILLKNTPQHRRQSLYPTEEVVDVLLIIDCIYHPSLLSPLVETIDYLAAPSRTAVIVVSELRSEQVIREFLDLWLAIPGWKVYRGPWDMVSGPYVVWIGWKENS